MAGAIIENAAARMALMRNIYPIRIVMAGRDYRRWRAKVTASHTGRQDERASCSETGQVIPS